MSQVNLKDRVVWFSDDGPQLGTVRWIGDPHSNLDQCKVGVEFDTAIRTDDDRENLALFIPAMELIRAEEFYGTKELVPTPHPCVNQPVSTSTLIPALDINDKSMKYESHSLYSRFPVVFNSEIFKCPICYDDIIPGDGVILSDCIHSFCKNCLENHVRSSDAAEVTCPFVEGNSRCCGIIQEKEMRSFMSVEGFGVFLHRVLQIAEAQASNSIHCQTPGCNYWFVLENADDADSIGIMVCPTCLRNNCLKCRAIHDEQTCDEYKLKLANDKDLQNTEETIKGSIQNGSAMKCPNCGIVIEKTVGCDSIICHACKMEICWATKGPRWGKGGSGDTTGGCRCNVNGVLCHPQCQNCH